MINPELLEILRCPLDPGRKTSFVPAEDHLLCPRCRVRFPIKDGFPVLVAEEADLPAGCTGLDQLPCQREAASERPGGAPDRGPACQQTLHVSQAPLQKEGPGG